MSRYSFVLCVVIVLFGSSFGLNCNLSLPRLLLGNYYSDRSSTETALIMFDTLDKCTDAVLLPLDGSDFTFKLKETVLQFVDEELNHSGNSKEWVKYNKYSIVFAVTAQPGKKYSVGFQGDSNDASTKSSLSYSFVLPTANPQQTRETAPKIVFTGDQDLTTRGAATIKYMTDNEARFNFDAFIFLGDYAYEFYQNNGQKGDAYVEQFAPLSFAYPLAMTPGNHEDNLNFTLFNEKFQLPGFNLENLNNYNSFDIGNIHFIHVNLQHYTMVGSKQQQKMVDWVTNDVKNVNRTATPWVIAVGHKLINCYDPLYAGNPDCLSYIKKFAVFDAIFATEGVDMFITGHEHFNQVMAPMYNKTIQDYTYNANTNELSYTQGGYLSIIQGNGGCATTPNRLRVLDTEETLEQASIFLNNKNVGFGWIQAFNDTYLEYHSWDAENDKELQVFKITSNHTRISTATPTPTPTNDDPKPNPTTSALRVTSALVLTVLATLLAF